jgi:uncharacterized membrane protein
MIDMKTEDKLNLAEKSSIISSSARAYLFSKKATWFWVIIALALSAAVAVFTIPEAAYPFTYIRSALGLIFVAYLPGYALVEALFPEKLPKEISREEIDKFERVALSLGTSLIIAPMVGFVLNYTPWYIRSAPITFSLLGLTLLLALAALFRKLQIELSAR